VYEGANAPLVPRGGGEITALFGGFELVEPGVVFAARWRPILGPHRARWVYAGVGRIPVR
jgi:hypothetical protein